MGQHSEKVLSIVIVSLPVDIVQTQGVKGSLWLRQDDVTKRKHFPRYWPFVRWIHRSPVNSPHKGQRRGALMFSLICAWINGWINNRAAGDFRRYRAHYDIIVIVCYSVVTANWAQAVKNSFLRGISGIWWLHLNRNLSLIPGCLPFHPQSVCTIPRKYIWFLLI